jgi:hypothetical protein
MKNSSGLTYEFASPPFFFYDFFSMSIPTLLPCDGCGQPADTAHISRRLERLAFATRFRPVHIQSLLLSGISPVLDSEYLYSPQCTFQGEVEVIIQASQIVTQDKSHEAILAEFQKLGLMLSYLLECPLEAETTNAKAQALMESQLPATIARIRRSLKPKRVLVLSNALSPFTARLRQSDLGCPVLPASTGVFLPAPSPTETDLQSLRSALSIF